MHSEVVSHVAALVAYQVAAGVVAVKDHSVVLSGFVQLFAHCIPFLRYSVEVVVNGVVWRLNAPLDLILFLLL